jgi:phosphoribosylformimino-5-aminoimidazole carboxamide ribotide isomerase
MDVVPVIDLKRGEVVHARRGQRDDYRTIETALSPSSAPHDVVAGLRRLSVFRHVYVADLDAITGQGDHGAELVALQARFPGLSLWVDNGIHDVQAARDWLDRHKGLLVIGSESQRSAGILCRLGNLDRVVLSLDFCGDVFQGPPDILADCDVWPSRVIVMTLARVGTAEGPDIVRLADIAQRAQGRRVYAAGGVRNAEDLRACASAGAAGALVATALHSGALTPQDLTAVARL